MDENEQLLQKYTDEANFDNKPATIALDYRILTKFFRTLNKPAKEITKADVSNYFHSLKIPVFIDVMELCNEVFQLVKSLLNETIKTANTRWETFLP